ncbi:MAG TPA: sulfatase-like hydrolase/transferase [Acidobacteriota bacterium]|nr:sulfatase-like hydrolase/transferase [Acidobacteriota bacterium]
MKRPIELACLSICMLRSLCAADNILLISVDTMRADHLSCYGYRQNKTPAIDRWAAEGIRFENAYTEYPLTLPAHSTLLTGTYPSYHGVLENVGFALGSDRVTLAEVLRENGFSTGGFIGSYVLASQFGLAQGFGTYDEKFGVPFEKAIAATALRRPAEQVTDSFLAWLSKQRESRFFAFVHFYDPHAPCPDGYDAEVTRVDRSIGRIDALLRKWNLINRTLIFLVSDHGESLGEHGESGHGFFLYDSTLHVPWIVRPPAGITFTRKAPSLAVSLADVMPTILQLSSVKGPAQMQGRSLVGIMSGTDTENAGGVYAETFIPQLQFGWSPLRSVRIGKYKLIDAPRAELYDLAADPGEKVNILTGNQAVANQLRAKLEESAAGRRNRGGTGAAGPVLEAREKLAALGYVQLGTSSIRRDFGKGVDPKDRIGVFEGYHAVLNDIAGRRITESVFERIGAIRKQAPELRQLIFLEAQACEGLGRLQDAASMYRKGLAQEPGNTIARSGLASLLIRIGKLDEAEKELRQVLAGDPNDYRSRNNLAGIYGMKGRGEDALAELKKALATRPAYAAGWHNLGQLYARMKKWTEAESALRKAVNLDRNDARAHLLLGRVLKAEGKAAEADRYMRLALELDPGLASPAPQNPR